ncbi:UNKNOWN [Stylonychia lemnae]|uniref:Uncharacterized protein n=1 Tax=Stylonychia lemnae TaxID=5949 RepID=A0A078A7D9_STYLE|nr:UNKNOWN [Stylonychia lemnae]|eukprot:CDW78165.1 UNKNOWN [Stylonychia lemnae]
MSCNGYIVSFEPNVQEKKLYVVGPEGIEQQVIDRLSKWATASKKELGFMTKEEVEISQ